MTNRSFQDPAYQQYRWGFNGKEDDSDFGSSIQDYGFRIYCPQCGRFLSVDPLTQSYPANSPYTFAENDVIRNIDLDGLEKICIIHSLHRGNQLKDMTQKPLSYKTVLGELETYKKIGFTKAPDPSGAAKYAKQKYSYNFGPNLGSIITEIDMPGGRQDDIIVMGPTGDPGKETFGVIYSSGRYFEPIGKQLANVFSELATKVNPFAIDIGYDFAFGGGMGYHVGLVFDAKGNYGVYKTLNANMGLAGGLGADVIPIWQNDKNGTSKKFTLDMWAGKGIDFSLSLGPIEASYGGNIDGSKGWLEEPGLDYRTGIAKPQGWNFSEFWNTIKKNGISAFNPLKPSNGFRIGFSTTTFIYRSDEPKKADESNK